jgi:hypothetical protein
MGRYPCIWAFRVGSLQVRNVEVYVSVEGLWTPFFGVAHFECFRFSAFPVLAVFLDPILGSLPILAHSLESMTFWGLFLHPRLDSNLGAEVTPIVVTFCAALYNRAELCG